MLCDVTVHVTNAISNTKHIVIEIQGLTLFSISQSYKDLDLTSAPLESEFVLHLARY